MLLLGAGGLRIEMSGADGLEYAYDGFVGSFSPGPSVGAIYSKEIITFLSLPRGHILLAL